MSRYVLLIGPMDATFVQTENDSCEYTYSFAFNSDDSGAMERAYLLKRQHQGYPARLYKTDEELNITEFSVSADAENTRRLQELRTQKMRIEQEIQMRTNGGVYGKSV